MIKYFFFQVQIFKDCATKGDLKTRLTEITFDLKFVWRKCCLSSAPAFDLIVRDVLLVKFQYSLYQVMVENIALVHLKVPTAKQVQAYLHSTIVNGDHRIFAILAFDKSKSLV